VASPVTYVGARVPPFLIVQGEDDRTIPAAQARAMYDAIRARNGHAELLLMPGIDHNFLGKTPAATRDASLKAWERTVGFIDRTVGDAGRRERARGD
jgi:dipeptidyl aminopeptidase/acylaminoacyl peptidase